MILDLPPLSLAEMMAGVSLVGTVVALLRKPIDRASADLAETVERIDQMEDRLVRVESDLEHLPDRDTTHRLEMAIARLEGRLETMNARLDPVAAMAARVQDMALEGKLG